MSTFDLTAEEIISEFRYWKDWIRTEEEDNSGKYSKYNDGEPQAPYRNGKAKEFAAIVEWLKENGFGCQNCHHDDCEHLRGAGGREEY